MASVFIRSVQDKSRCIASSLLSSTRLLSTQPAASENPSAEPKPFSSIPGPRVWPVVGSVLGFLTADRAALHKFFDIRTKKYGKIYKEERSPLKMVFINDPKYLQSLFQHEGKYPQRNEIAPFKLHREVRGLRNGVLLSDGEDWYRHRHAMNSYMLRPKSVASHTEDLNDIITDFMQLLDSLLKETNDGQINNLQDVLFRWAIESGGSVIFDERLGSVSDNPPEDILQFIQAIQQVLKTAEVMLFLPPKLAKALHLPIWRKHAEGWDTCFSLARKIVTEKGPLYQEELDAGREVSGLLASLLQNPNLDSEDVISDTLDLMGGAVDTTSISMAWLLHLLSKHPDKQQLLVDEISRVLPSGGVLGQQELRNMPYLKAIVKETLRLYPVAPFVGRVLEEDIVIAGYNIPKGVSLVINLWTIGRDPDVYEDPESFKPERWIRGHQEREDVNPYAHLVFGHGVRSCVGRRVAELEMYLLLTRLLQKYEIVDTDPGTDVETETRIVLVPRTELKIAFRPRH